MQNVFNLGIIVIFILILMYIFFESWKHQAGFKFGHEASLVTTVGLAVGACALFFEGENTVFQDLMEFNGTMFFYFVLPPIVFAAGFNMYRKKFFANIKNVLLFGIIGTFVAFGAYTSITLLFSTQMQLEQHVYDKQTGKWSV